MADADNTIRYAPIRVLRDNDEVLICPGCEEANLHHGTVMVFSRSAEDAKEVVTLVGVTAILNEKNPSSRRDGIAIAFICEHCNVKAELTIAQHKGATLIGWRYSPE